MFFDIFTVAGTEAMPEKTMLTFNFYFVDIGFCNCINRDFSSFEGEKEFIGVFIILDDLRICLKFGISILKPETFVFYKYEQITEDWIRSEEHTSELQSLRHLV